MIEFKRNNDITKSLKIGKHRYETTNERMWPWDKIVYRGDLCIITNFDNGLRSDGERTVFIDNISKPSLSCWVLLSDCKKIKI